MRLWHIDLIPYLPNSQLVAQWRELNSIFKKQDKHILINYIYDYDKDYLYIYSLNVIDEMERRNFVIRSYDNFNNYFNEIFNKPIPRHLRFDEHDNEYLTICYYNLKEKYLRGQKDFSLKIFLELTKFCLTHME